VLFIVQRGRVQASAVDATALDPTAATLTEGECFPVGALIGNRAPTLAYRAATDAFCYVLEAARFEALRARSPEFQAFCSRRLATLLDRSMRNTREAYAARAASELSMASPLRAAIRRPAQTLPQEASVRQGLELMKARRIGSVVLTGGDGRPVGIFTRTDVLDRVALAGPSLDRPISEVMTREPASLAASRALSEAAEFMARHGIGHLLVTEGDLLLGVVSERDLFGLQRHSMQGLRKDIGRADGVETLVFLAREVRGLATTMLAQGVAAEQLTQFVSALNDAITARAVELALRHHDVAEIGFCWMGLGSEGRSEQTLVTDQDNAIVFPDQPVEVRDQVRARLLAFAAEVNATLDQCGFPLCAGDIMARNPRWCLSLSEWCGKFEDWTQNIDMEALLNATIFFDFRAIYGDTALVQRLREFLLRAVEGNMRFLRQMAANALLVRPPLGFFGAIRVDGAEGGTLDLKRLVARPFADSARVLALASGVGAVSTVERLRETGRLRRLSDDEIAANVDAFHFVQMLRLRTQDRLERDGRGKGPNLLDPDDLNDLDRRILREALRQARKLQNRVAVELKL
jgi:CBS domain-containing protein